MKSLIGSKEISPMTGGNVTEKQVPWWTLHEVADELEFEEERLPRSHQEQIKCVG